MGVGRRCLDLKTLFGTEAIQDRIGLLFYFVAVNTVFVWVEHLGVLAGQYRICDHGDNFCVVRESRPAYYLMETKKEKV